MTLNRLIAAAVLALAAGAALAIEFKTVGPAPAIFYDAPSVRGARLYVAPEGMPVEVVSGYGEWVKVRDFAGDMAWTEAKNLAGRRTVIVRSAEARVHAQAGGADVLMVADKGVVLELLDTEITAWVRVRHKDGITGYVKASDLWGI